MYTADPLLSIFFHHLDAHAAPAGAGDKNRGVDGAETRSPLLGEETAQSTPAGSLLGLLGMRSTRPPLNLGGVLRSPSRAANARSPLTPSPSSTRSRFRWSSCPLPAACPLGRIWDAQRRSCVGALAYALSISAPPLGLTHLRPGPHQKSSVANSSAGSPRTSVKRRRILSG